MCPEGHLGGKWVWEIIHLQGFESQLQGGESPGVCTGMWDPVAGLLCHSAKRVELKVTKTSGNWRHIFRGILVSRKKENLWEKWNLDREGII